MGSCCTSGKGQALPDTNTTIADRPTKPPKTYEEYVSDSSDSNYEGETVDSGFDYDGNDTSVSIKSYTNDSQQKIISGFKSAVQRGNDSLVMYYNQENPTLNLLNIKFENGDSTLHVAVRKKAYSLIKYLLDNGISPNVQNERNGDTPLHTAAGETREVKLVILLCTYDADINIENRKHEKALTIAVENGDKDIIEVLSPKAQDLIGTHIRGYSEDVQYDQYDDIDDPDDVPFLDNMSTQRLDNFTEDILESKPKLDDDATSSLKPSRNYQIFNGKNGKKHNKFPERPSLKDERSLEEKLDAKTIRKLQEIKIARTNPFSKLERRNTQITLQAMQNITAQAGNLPKLEAWLEQKNKYSWQKRWVIVKESHFLWSDKQRSIKDPKSAHERAKFNGCISLLMITKVEPITKKSKSQRKFEITGKEAKSKEKVYKFRAASPEDRDYWVKSLRAHINHMKELVAYLGTKQ